MDVTLITPTADRPAAVALCAYWVGRMVERAVEHQPGLRVEWIVSDGGHKPVDLSRMTPAHFDLRYIRAHPHVCAKRNFRFNLIAALEASRGERVLFIEDDDWYHAEYLCGQISWLEEHDIAGEGNARYYNLASRQFRTMNNRSHASLCQTGIRRSLVAGLVRRIRRETSAFVDIHLWRNLAASVRKNIRPASKLCVGIKGLPGRPGIGVGHRMTGRRVDRNGSILRQWVGDADAGIYERLLEAA